MSNQKTVNSIIDDVNIIDTIFESLKSYIRELIDKVKDNYNNGRENERAFIQLDQMSTFSELKKIFGGYRNILYQLDKDVKYLDTLVDKNLDLISCNNKSALKFLPPTTDTHKSFDHKPYNINQSLIQRPTTIPARIIYSTVLPKESGIYYMKYRGSYYIKIGDVALEGNLVRYSPNNYKKKLCKYQNKCNKSVDECPYFHLYDITNKVDVCNVGNKYQVTIDNFLTATKEDIIIQERQIVHNLIIFLMCKNR